MINEDIINNRCFYFFILSNIAIVQVKVVFSKGEI